MNLEAAHKEVVGQHGWHRDGDADAGRDQCLADGLGDDFQARRTRHSNGSQSVDNAEHGAEKSNEWRRTADAGEHSQSRFGGTALLDDLGLQRPLKGLACDLGCFGLGFGHRRQTRLRQAPKRPLVVLQLAQYRQLGCCSESARKAPVLRLHGPALASLDKDQCPREYRGKEQEAESSLNNELGY